MQVLRLAQGSLRAEIAPAVGGSLSAFWSEGADGRRIDWLRPATPQALERLDPLGMGSFPLLPFCNRIRNGRARFEGRNIAFPPNHPSVASPHPLHGIGWQRPWAVLSADGEQADLALKVEPSAAWPWRFSARQQYVLRAGVLEARISLTNEDTAAMPAGIGHHPYFLHHPGTRLQTATAAMWLTDAEVMPTVLQTGGVVDRLRAGVLLSELDQDNNFVGWAREAHIDWLADAHGPARSLVMRADESLHYFVLYCPRGADHFCAEPVSQCTDWLNLIERYGRGPLGGARLPPGGTLAASFTLQPSGA
jgi:aldose 1-epimerase